MSSRVIHSCDVCSKEVEMNQSQFDSSSIVRITIQYPKIIDVNTRATFFNQTRTIDVCLSCFNDKLSPMFKLKVELPAKPTE